ncbi:PA2169 family four-helix-bundle protein [Chitinimonas arctica]|uniref:PA2169 family four-helix-bundle protein n=1 Tax=Chitinimonas arctica TaxID=2594795 RepID=A0A516SHB7_9NEIS|nr:PA2169 family four-helix-bundle protein [Chitinimonas arctica]QDQ27556.1 PA2169 family four-helix-bundle protein [Chitinimonas arctica]
MLNEDIVDTLNDLIETSTDGELGFENCAKYVESPELRNLFIARAQECRRAADELKALVLQYGGQPDTGGTATGALHRGWVNIRGTLAGQSDPAMLDECERGEDAAKARYRAAMEKGLPEPLRAIVLRQMEGVLRHHDQIRALRTRYADADA